ncbi:MAG TPA: energy transducer TonB [Terriglobales bacterium]|jgi:protein TonB|nr:energy transducer TonB [Terriglobales bacterium]
MFAGLENIQANPRRGWTAFMSFTLQAAAVAAAIAIPLMYPNRLPDALAHRRIFVPINGPVIPDRPAPPQPDPSHTGPMLSSHPLLVTEERGIHFNASTNNNLDDSTDSPVDPWGFARGVQSVGPNLGNGPVNVIRPIAAIPVRVSRSMQGYLLRRVEPIYPTMAKTVGVQGQVLIKAIISTEGKIEQAKVVSGSPLLSSAALDAIRQWLYRPYLLNDKPVEVETEITVNFYLTH